MICKVTLTFYLLQKRNQRWRALEKRSDEIVKYIDIKKEIEEKMPHFQEEQGWDCQWNLHFLYDLRNIIFLIIFKFDKFQSFLYSINIF